MVARIGFFATTSRKPRQARKGTTVAAMSGAEGQLVRATSHGVRAVEKRAVETRTEVNFGPS